MLTEAGTSLKGGLKSNLRLTGVVFGVVAADTLELQHLSIAKWKTLGNMRPICEFEKLAFDSKIVWSHGHILTLARSAMEAQALSVWSAHGTSALSTIARASLV